MHTHTHTHSLSLSLSQHYLRKGHNFREKQDDRFHRVALWNLQTIALNIYAFDYGNENLIYRISLSSPIANHRLHRDSHLSGRIWLSTQVLIFLFLYKSTTFILLLRQYGNVT